MKNHQKSGRLGARFFAFAPILRYSEIVYD